MLNLELIGIANVRKHKNDDSFYEWRLTPSLLGLSTHVIRPLV